MVPVLDAFVFMTNVFQSRLTVISLYALSTNEPGAGATTGADTGADTGFGLGVIGIEEGGGFDGVIEPVGTKFKKTVVIPLFETALNVIDDGENDGGTVRRNSAVFSAHEDA